MAFYSWFVKMKQESLQRCSYIVRKIKVYVLLREENFTEYFFPIIIMKKNYKNKTYTSGLTYK